MNQRQMFKGLAIVAFIGWLSAAAVPLQAAGPIGVNIGMPEFVDAAKEIGGFGPLEPKGKVSLDESGWPLTDCKILLISSRAHMIWNDNGKDPNVVVRDESGTYHVSLTGKATVGPAESGMGEIQNQKYDEKTNTTTAELVVPQGCNHVVLTFKDTQGGFKNLKIIRPGYAADTKQLFTDRFLKGLEPFDTIRIMDFLYTNHHSHPGEKKGYPKLEEWKDRRLTTDASQAQRSGKDGAAWEYAIALVNQIHKNLWINVPVGASDDYVEKLAELLKKDLDPKLLIYVEYSNEVWNWGFCQSWWNDTKAKKRAAAATQPGGDPKDEGMTYGKQYAERTAQIAFIFKKVFGAEAMITRIRPVLAWQPGWVQALQNMCEFLAARYGEPRKYIYGLSFAPYLNSKDTSSVDACIKGMMEAGDQNGQWVRHLAAVAKRFGLHAVSYEGGPGLSGEKDLEFKIAANRDPRMAEVIKHFMLEGWFASGGELFMQYSYCSAFGRYGNWGIVEPTYDLNTPKYRAYLDILKAPQPALTNGPLVPKEVGGKLAINQTEALGLKNKPKATIKLVNGQPHLAYACVVQAPGTYAITIGGDPKDKGELEVLVDQQAETVTLPVTITKELEPGLHAITILPKDRAVFGGGHEIVIERTK